MYLKNNIQNLLLKHQKKQKNDVKKCMKMTKHKIIKKYDLINIYCCNYFRY